MTRAVLFVLLNDLERVACDLDFEILESFLSLLEIFHQLSTLVQLRLQLVRMSANRLGILVDLDVGVERARQRVELVGKIGRSPHQTLQLVFSLLHERLERVESLIRVGHHLF